MAPDTVQYQMASSTLRALSEDAVAHARATDKAGELAWAHILAESTQDPDAIADTLATDAPLAWGFPVLFGEDDTIIYFPGPSSAGIPARWRFLLQSDRESIRHEYDVLREWMDIKGWESFWEVRSNWYVAFHGYGGAELTETGELTRVETVAIFPVGGDGILGELHFSAVGAARENRWPEAPAGLGDLPDPKKRAEAMRLQNQFVEALRKADVDAVLALHREDSILLIRNYLTAESTHLTVDGADEIRQYYSQLFERYQIHNVELVHKMVETWYVFAELHWTVQERSGDGRVLEFCTAEVFNIDPDCKIWARAGGGTDPVEVD